MYSVFTPCSPWESTAVRKWYHIMHTFVLWRMTPDIHDHISKYNNAKRSIPAHPHICQWLPSWPSLWTVTSKSIGSTMVNMSAKFDEEAHNGLVCSRFTAYFHTCQLWSWPLTYELQNQQGPSSHQGLLNISAKFDEEMHYSLVSIVFTSLSTYMSIMTLTYDLWPSQ